MNEKEVSAMEEEDSFYPDTDLDLSFTSTTTDRTFSSSARSSLARSSLTLSFNERLSTNTASATTYSAAAFRRKCNDAHWSAIKTASLVSSDGQLHLRHLKLVRRLGAGNLGRVFLCHLRDFPPESAAKFALKVIDRDGLTPKKLSHVQTEAEILSVLDHPFLPTLYARIEASHYTCLLIDYCPNGDLHSLLRKQPGNRLPISSARFFAAEVLVALEYLHALGIVYRDLKPENILLREDGHIMLSDFDLCFKSDVVPSFKTRRISKTTSSRRRNRCGCFGTPARDVESQEEMVGEFTAEPVTAFSRSCVGTHEYLAPELVNGNGHGNGVDWWAFGIFLYELIYGTTPFKGGGKDHTLRNIASANDVAFHVSKREEIGTAEARDLIRRLLVKDPAKRLGCTRGAQDIKRHPFFDGIKWPLIRNYKPPEVRGLVKRSKSHATPATPRRRRGWWRALSQFLKSKSTNQIHSSNNNSYHYVVNKIKTSKHV